MTGEQFSDLAVWDPDADVLIDPLDTFQGGWAGVGRMGGVFTDGTQGAYDVLTARGSASSATTASGSDSQRRERLYVWYPDETTDGGTEIWAFDARPAGGTASGRIGPAIFAPGQVQWVTATAGGERVVVNSFGEQGSRRTCTTARRVTSLAGH